MEFWGAEVKAGKPLKVKPDDDYRIHVSQASLDKGNKGERVLLYVTFDGKKLLMGTLSQENIPQISFNLVFEKEFELSHSSKGSVHFTGYKSPNIEKEDDSEDDGSDIEKRVDVDEDDSEDEDDSDDEQDESDDEEETHMKPEPSNKKRKNESAAPVSAKKAKSAVATTPQETGVFDCAQRLTDLLESHDPVTKKCLESFSKEEGEPSSFPNYLEKSTPLPEEAFFLPDWIIIDNIDLEAEKADVEKFFELYEIKVSGIHLDPDTGRQIKKQVALVQLVSSQDLEKAMSLSGRRLQSAANGKYSRVFCKRKKNSLRVFFLSGYDHKLTAEEIIQQVKEAFSSDKENSATVKTVVLPENASRRFCYLVMDNVTHLNLPDILAVSTVGGRRIKEFEKCNPIGSVFEPYL
ncbi:hypothetical protein IGI04_036246 [Brassica rapa subsp. trilocularis]|uniref:Nucleoplasmin-like domain-containing protein n=1 Tax=Brassica rapa subsp. trilocularis TaxID=1813537 RepID=A0ABQ7LG92_BRACM|nr:hypothetical protein IGI04_036246 [Brassica rapa subsp. trilocularis]